MAYDINTALERLETTLKDVESAKSQVEKTISASESLRSTVEKYVSSIGAFHKELKSMEDDFRERQFGMTQDVQSYIDAIRTLCDGTTDSINNSLENISSSFSASIGETLKAFGSQVERLEGNVEKMDALRKDLKGALVEMGANKEILLQISKDLKDSQYGQDVALREINQAVSSLPQSIKKLFEGQAGLGKRQAETLTSIMEATEELKNAIRNQVKSLESTSGRIEALSMRCVGSLEKIKQHQEETAASIAKSTLINRWILIGGIAALAILHFV